jgi:RimJ/RimL family protein N-acetyltransferase
VQETQVSKIRPATPDDVFDILILAKEFSKEAPQSHKWSKAKTEAFLFSALQSDTMTILVLEVNGDIVGAIVAVVTEMYMSHTTIASELAWFVSKEYRGKTSSLKLVFAYEDWAKSKHAQVIGMGDIEGIANLEKLYTRMGYKKSESVYMKEL